MYTYAAFAVQVSGDQFIGLFTGGKDDILAYIQENHPAYDWRLECISPKHITHGYAENLKAAKIKRDSLKIQLAHAEKNVKSIAPNP